MTRRRMMRDSLLKAGKAIVVILLTLSLAAFPSSGTHAAAAMGHHHGAILDHAPEGTSAARHASDESASASHDCHFETHQTGGCCEMGHLALGTLAGLPAPAPLLWVAVTHRDEQVRSECSFRIDRPPRPA
jgi:hypothetical protein